MKNQITVTDLELKPAPQGMIKDAQRIFDNVALAQNQHIAANYTLEQVVDAMRLARAIREASNSAAKPGLLDILGKTPEQIQGWVDSATLRYNRSAGARALSRKYGKDGAEAIIEKHTGRKVQLQN